MPRLRPSIYHKPHTGSEFDTHALLFFIVSAFPILDTGVLEHLQESLGRKCCSASRILFCLLQQKLGAQRRPLWQRIGRTR